MNLLAVMYMRDTGKMEKEMVEEFIFGRLEKSITVIGEMIG